MRGVIKVWEMMMGRRFDSHGGSSTRWSPVPSHPTLHFFSNAPRIKSNNQEFKLRTNKGHSIVKQLPVFLHWLSLSDTGMDISHCRHSVLGHASTILPDATPIGQAPGHQDMKPSLVAVGYHYIDFIPS